MREFERTQRIDVLDRAGSGSQVRDAAWRRAAPATPRRRRRRRRPRPRPASPSKVAGRFDEAAPVFEHLGRLAVNLQPGQRFLERAAVHQRAPGARRQAHVDQPALQRQDLPQPLDVAPGERQHARARAAAPSCIAVGQPAAAISVRSEWPSGTSSDPSRMALVSVSGARCEPAAIGVERRQRLPERVAGAALQLRRRSARAAGARPASGTRCSGGARAQQLVELFDQPRRRAARDLAAMRRDGARRSAGRW